MTRNLGAVDRWLRVLAALVLAACAVVGPFSLPVRLGLLGLNAGYLLWSALAGSCVGYQRNLGERLWDDDNALVDALDPQTALERWQLVQAVHAGIARLERPYREVLILRDLEGLSGDEACAVLGLDLSAMKTRLHRARRQLRAILERSVATPKVV
jgi:hypothetical protein